MKRNLFSAWPLALSSLVKRLAVAVTCCSILLGNVGAAQAVATTTGLTSSKNPSVCDQSVTFTAVVNAVSGGPPTGTVTFLINGFNFGTVPLSASGTASLTVGNLGPGPKPVVANYNGNAGFDPSSASILQRLSSAHDFNRDCKGDILWHHAAGETVIWLMNGASAIGGGSLGTVPSIWGIVGQRDFNGDGFTDILWRDNNTGAVAVWFMNGLQVTTTANLGVVTLDWTVQGLNAD